LLIAAAAAGVVALLVFVIALVLPYSSSKTKSWPRKLAAGGHLTVWWDELPADVQAKAVPAGKTSNIHPADYVGPQACAKCHSRNYELWSKHSHRRMNALADDETVKGDFTGATINYRGGQATFFREGDHYRMRLGRDGVRRTYAITQTIGIRFHQYYVGRQIEGPEPQEHQFYRDEHVLPFGFWLEQKEWVPVVHIGPETADERRVDPFTPPDEGIYYAEYASSCNYCHTTFPLGDLIGRRTQQIGKYAPVSLHWSMRPYLEKAHPDELPAMAAMLNRPTVENPMAGWTASQHAVTLGISCEACHLGAKIHVDSAGKIPPKFIPTSPYLAIEGKEGHVQYGRTQANVNWACGRCHVGSRPTFAAGMSTWNSVEYSDAMLGSCYSQLKCIDCHNPHQAIGPRWSRSADHDDGLCLKCHESLKPEEARTKHTHHPAGSEGARCMNCHMPRINEGIRDVVRTHMIYSPTRADMLEANHPNACNVCHTDRPIDWTLQHLKDWYGKTYDESRIAAKYPKREHAATLGWLKSDNPAVRLVAAEALTRAKDSKALPQLLETLDDSQLVNRQFAYKGLQDMLNVRLADFGYRFYMTKAERTTPLERIRERLAATR
jgi:predicted CXXCH cytochrome family protein